MPTSSLKCFCLALEKRKQLLSVSLISTATICTNLNSYSRDLQKNFNLGNNKSVNLELTESKNKELSKVIHWRAELADPCCQSITVKSFTEKPDREKKTTNEGKKKVVPTQSDLLNVKERDREAYVFIKHIAEL